MPQRIKAEDSKFYFNEFKHFPMEKLFIPILVGAIIVGLFFAGKAIMRSMSPATGAEKIMDAVQRGSGEDIYPLLKLTEEQLRRLEYNVDTASYGNDVIREFKALGFEIVGYKVDDTHVVQQGDQQIVPIAITVRAKDGSTKTATVKLPLVRDGGRWRTTTEDLRHMLIGQNSPDQ